jgi:hypothetical protein
MKNLMKAAILATLPLIALGSQAEVTRDCIMEGTVDKKKAERANKDVYVAFHSARNGDEARCNLKRGHKIEFKQPKDDELKNAPHGATVKYRYTEENRQQGEWQLIDVSSL